MLYKIIKLIIKIDNNIFKFKIYNKKINNK